ncbi:MAG: DNA alkylation repair protein [Candidatus Bathyarchaeota archaeon]|nr:DNA alkylation repair protein [Chloroflexota bacterium]MCL5877436.1 DNA alkylation repair protein [Candidatus Bathyarchaeota archaeon]
MNSILSGLRADLKVSIDEKTKQSAQHFFKEQIKVYGIKTATVGKIAKKYWPEVELLGKQELFGLCEELLRSGYMEEAFVVSNWLPEYIENLEAADITTFKRWIESYIDNWAKCDSFCNHTVGDLIQKYPEIVGEVKSWAKSQNRWLKRASAVSFIVPAKRGNFLKDAFEICDVLLLDGDDMVQKGYGWLLKEESRMHQKEVFDYVVKHRKDMPRTALRYAIELMPKELKAEAMKKE